MIDANSQFLAILTNVGMAKQANADALGIPWKITEMGVGDANGTDPIPSVTQTKLINEWRRRPLNQLKTDPADPRVLIAEQIIPADEGGKWIREIGLYDIDGDLVAVANCAPSFKPVLSQGSGRTQIVRMNFIVSSTGNITLKIDPSVVLASRDYVDQKTSGVRDYVDQKVLEELGKLDFKNSVLVTTYANEVLSGLRTIDGVALVAGARVLVKNQTVAKDNGLYNVSAGAWTRTTDADSSLEVTPGLFVHVERGGVNGDSMWQLVTDGPIVLGTTDLVFEMIAGKTGFGTSVWRSVTVDKNGRVIAGTNPTTLAAYGITDAFNKTEVAAAISAAIAQVVTSVSASKTLTAQELGLVLIDASAGPLTLQLPLADAGLGVRDVIVRRVDNSVNRLVVQAGGTNKIKFHTHLSAAGYPFFVLMGNGDWWRLRSDSAGSWWPIGRFDSTSLGRPVLETTVLLNPGGWGAIAGVSVLRAEWPWLWDHAQQSGMLTTEAARTGMEGGWTSGDGSTTLRGPELRGEWLQVLDESRGVDAARVAGSWKASDNKAHNHGLSGGGGYGTTMMGGGTNNYTLWTAGSTASSGGAEARPRGIAYPGRIKMI